MNYLLSIIIPTKNRYSTLLPLLDFLVTIDSQEVEFVVHDNSDNNEKILKHLKEVNDKRISYYHTLEKLSQTGNSDQAVLKSTGEYVCFIGDDDGVMPYIIDVVKWMKNNTVDVIKSYKPMYTWPGLQSNILENNKSGVLKFKEGTFKIIDVNLPKVLNNALKKGGTNINELPCLYHGIAERSVLNKIYKKTGSFFPGPSPDMANAIALCFYTNNFKYLDFPVVISGKSSSSIGGRGVLHQHIARIEDVGHLPNKTKENWDKRIPRYWTGPTIWAQSVLDALRACNQENKIEDFNFKYLYAKLFVFDYNKRNQIFKDFRFSLFNFKFIFSCVKIFINRVYIFLYNRSSFNRIIQESNIKTIGDAIRVLNSKFDKEKLPF
ncbi:glycosyltransferase [Mesoflavibacter sp. CH_XMU1422-2]|uniref:glycosyltransferase n=1 Tax=Mesoflavibacter sp. CH_XMU1422-2 TaxID=3107770 RepID=UPI003009A673